MNILKAIKAVLYVLRSVPDLVADQYYELSIPDTLSWEHFPILTDKEAIAWEAVILHGRGHSERVVAERLGITRHAVRKALGK